MCCSCLDILSDYLRGRMYPHERIDGSVPGDQRQASIDRFSTMPIDQSFVFLLCTRAGGVGINLTVRFVFRSCLDFQLTNLFYFIRLQILVLFLIVIGIHKTIYRLKRVVIVLVKRNLYKYTV